MNQCKAVGCSAVLPTTHSDFCPTCTKQLSGERSPDAPLRMSQKYPKYYKDFTGDNEVDVYMVHHRFGIEDCSGAIHHASKKLLLSGVRTGGKSKYQDIREARDTLNRWLEINAEQA